ncbi:MAG: aspartate/glutamate racemase family protein [Bacillota bacterium]|nr:aspartate/glutamate racemase family protein [Bacillota bacterium]
MENKTTGIQYGCLHGENDGRFIRTKPWQQMAGYAIGIVYIEHVNYPLLPGNVVNACTYDYPVRLRAVPNLTNQRLFNADPSIARDIIETAKHMVEKEGVRAVCSACGFFGNYHKQVAAALDVPVAMSSLVQLPWIRTLLRPGKKVAILTANGAAITPALFDSCGISDYNDVIIKDMLHSEEFAAVVDMRGHFDNEKARNEVVNAAVEAVAEGDGVGAILLECSDMPPYSAAIQEATGLPVFDFITLIDWMHKAVRQRHYSGWV